MQNFAKLKNKLLSFIDNFCCTLLKRDVKSSQLFIIGLPRSGATLVYQYIVHRLHVAYFTNGAGNKPYIPCLTIFLQKTFRRPYVSDFKSNFGRVAGPMAPREAGRIWGKFFLPDKYETYENIIEKKRKELYRLVTCIQSIFGDVPFVNKNVRNSLHIDALAKIFPKSNFLVIERNLEDVALSILRARKLTHGDYNLWFSVKPRNYEEIKNLSIPEQIFHQIKDIRECINESIKKLPKDRVKVINYEDFCKEPELVINLFSNIFINVKEKNPPVSHFLSKKQHPNTTLEKELIKTITKL
ncbi:MAG: sulfotransferase [Proteobacteria bacterium]|nr:sulfotransferase [Pseudomonadota bacterium]